MADVPFMLYDSIVFANATNTTHTLFQVAQGADSTHTRQFTNMRASGQLPQNEKLVVRAIHAILWNTVPKADLADIWDGNTLELVLSDENIFRMPLKVFSSQNAYGGAIQEATATDLTFIGLQGMGYTVKPEITIMGGDSFRVDVFQQNAVAVAENMWIALEGVLTR